MVRNAIFAYATHCNQQPHKHNTNYTAHVIPLTYCVSTIIILHTLNAPNDHDAVVKHDAVTPRTHAKHRSNSQITWFHHQYCLTTLEAISYQWEYCFRYKTRASGINIEKFRKFMEGKTRMTSSIT